MINFKKLITGTLLAATILGFGNFIQSVEAGKVDDIKERGYITVGTTGDYKPMSYLDKATGKYEGFDTELSQLLAKSLNVEVKFVPTTWKTLASDTMAGKFDVAICGITRTFARQQVMDMSTGYLEFGKTILCRKADAKKFKSEADLNNPKVRVMVNPGGTNEKFALSNLPNCTLLVHQFNAEIPSLIAEGKADVMITETMEARRYIRDDARLAAPLIDDPFTKSQFGILMPKGDQDFLNYVNFFMEEMDSTDTIDKLEDKYIK
ncbi:MAG: transporter substrate-binding domain-containing protein [Phascolarctobacterium sp.]|nr:transporter substrate-binding domain-containing protein [Phascolarctobacterium sp.]